VLAGGTNGTPISPFTFTASGGQLPYTWSNSVGSPPTGLSLTAGGVLNGTPSVNGTTTWTVQVCDNLSSCATVQVSDTIIAPVGGCGPPNFCAYIGVNTVPWPSVPNVGVLTKNGSTVTDTSLPSSTQSRVVRCTDFAIEPGAQTVNGNAFTKSAGLGGSGDAEQMFNSNSTILHFNNSGGGGRLVLFNPTTMVCGDPVTGFDITADKNLTSPGSSSTAYAFGSGSFDWTDTGAPAGSSIYYAFGSGNDASALAVAKYTINQTNGQFTVIPTWVDFTYGLPLGALAPAWLPSHAYVTGDYVSATLTLGDWNGATAYIAGDLIMPLANNPLNCAFKLSTVGTRGTQPNPWSKLTDGSCVLAQKKTEGGGAETWRNLGGGAVFTFQLTSAGGSSSGSTPNWATASGHPDLLSKITDGSLTWTNTGPMIVPGWHSFGGVSKDGTRFCSGFSSNSYGHGAGSYNSDNGDQGTGIYAGCYETSTNRFILMNMGTGIQSSTSCSGPLTRAGIPNYLCELGIESKLTASGAAFSTLTGSCNYMLHNVKGGSTLDYVVFAEQRPTPPGPPFVGTCQLQLLDWQPFAAFNDANARPYNLASNHWTIGKSKLVNVGDQSIVGFSSGIYDVVYDSANPGAAPLTSWQVGAPFTNPCDTSSVWTALDPNPPCFFGQAYDSHFAFWHDPADDDLGPVCGSMYNIATLAPPPLAPYQGEAVCVSTTPLWAQGASIGAYKVWRFTHEFCTGGNAFFDTQFCISQLSTDGKFLAFSSDWNCTLGTTAGVASPLFCGAPWVGGTNYTTNTMINPFSGTNGTGTNFGVYQVQAPGGIASTTKPAWFVCTAGSAGTNVTDSNGIVYKCLGPGNGKGEVFITEQK
jgi:hypothetical protein